MSAARRSCRALWGALALAGLLGVSGCSLWGGSSKPKPAELGPNVPVLGVRQAWTARIGAVEGVALDVHVNGNVVTLASANGEVAAIDARTGGDVWRTQLNMQLASGVGSDGRWSAVVSRNAQVVVLDGAREIWRKSLPAQAYTAPLVAGHRVFVLAADRSITAFDAATGYQLWRQQRPGEPLILREGGVLMAVGDTLVAGLSGRLVGFNPDNGVVRWEAPLASPRGTNDVERLVEIVGRTSRVGDSVCARAFQATVGCIDAGRGTVLWTQPASGSEGIDGDGSMLFGTESNGTVAAWRRADGVRAWTSERLQFRKLTAPLLLGRSVVIGDDSGLVHLLSREDAAPLNRLTTDGSAIAASPVAAGDTLVVVTRKGGVYGFRPD
ncbi:outer membrane protein assembly factor BamB [Alicycliphilus denitrificans]|uniref:Outer membrane protein assembly factor BamB n=2 Tax=Alicycliphilus denitrificans TaxID=179636 RepID=F4GEL2_ALIDK|nr:outer membrane protein assembly factor BamB [Alicycliphilus denitrificans]ADV00760.1 outer membrane assembly lipoprotein YfgL [Alicycliphilus denitrificans BC]AEB83814.1 outer membrane assembly lipoprotein YfgL [Alicycliphilus denitrificans K601]QKD44881.1 outer membrane protein assembly factor BamB [Alicycliphilus denitrificans]GAO24267.1 outer membrane assembly lipoprotein YfgL [Alicycliphilus sp. B1]